MRQRDFDPARRRLLASAGRGLGALALASGAPALAEVTGWRETADLIVGPFYPERKPAETDADLTRLRGHARPARGQVVRLTGRLWNVRGEALAGRRLEIWQANSDGRYAHPSDPDFAVPLDPDFQGYAEVVTDRDGRFAITTVKPGAYRTPRGDMRAPHIHFEVHGTTDRKTTQMFFPDEPLNGQDRHLNSVRRPETVIARVTPTGGGMLVAAWDLVLTSG